MWQRRDFLNRGVTEIPGRLVEPHLSFLPALLPLVPAERFHHLGNGL